MVSVLAAWNFGAVLRVLKQGRHAGWCSNCAYETDAMTIKEDDDED